MKPVTVKSTGWPAIAAYVLGAGGLRDRDGAVVVAWAGELVVVEGGAFVGAW